MTDTKPKREINAWRLGGWGLALAALLAPVAIMQSTGQLLWGPGDFAAAASLIIGTGLCIELAMRLVRRPWLRIALAIAIFLGFATIWAELAVGLFS